MRLFSFVRTHLLAWTAILAVGPLLYQPNAGAQSSVESISVVGSRPLVYALEELEQRHRWVVTYEDAFYEYQPDLTDITAVARKGATPNGPRVFFAPTRPFVFNYPTADITKPETVLSNLVETYYDLWKDYEYKLLRQGDWFHVIPASSKNGKGTRAPRQSRLDVRVTIPDAERTIEETVDAVLSAVKQSSGTRIMGSAMSAPPLRVSIRTGARNEIARDVLMRLLEATGQRIRWHLLCDATAQCALNFRPIR